MDRAPVGNTSVLDSRKTELLDKLFSQLPKGLGVVNGTKKDVRAYLDSNHEQVPERAYHDSHRVLSSLLAPKSERPVVRSIKQVGTPPDVRSVLDPKVQPRIYGIQNLFSVIADVLRPDTNSGNHKPVQLNLGIGADITSESRDPSLLDISPALPSYITLGLERLRELSEVSEKVRLRIFSTGSLIAMLNGKDGEKIKNTQILQKRLIDEFIAEFYPDLLPFVSTDEVASDIPVLPRREYLLERDRVMPRLKPAILDSLQASGKRHGCNRVEDVIRYAVYHCLPTTFRDGDDSMTQVSIGGYSEDTFMAIRGFNDPQDKQVRLGIVARGVLAKTPAYLNRPEQMRPIGTEVVRISEIRMQEFVENSTQRVQGFMEDPHSDPSSFSRDLIHIGRSIGANGNIRDGVKKLQTFYQNLQSKL